MLIHEGFDPSTCVVLTRCSTIELIDLEMVRDALGDPIVQEGFDPPTSA